MNRLATMTLLTGVLLLLLGLLVLHAERPPTADRAFPGVQVGQTYFDAQHLTSMGRQIAHISNYGNYNDTVCVAFVERYSTSSQAYLSFVYLDDYDGYWDVFGYYPYYQNQWFAPDIDFFGNRILAGNAWGREDVDPMYGTVLRDQFGYSGFYEASAIPIATCGGEETGYGEWGYGFTKVAVDVNQYGDTSVHVVTTETIDYESFASMRSLVYFKGDSYPLDFGTCGTFIDSVTTRGAVIAASEYSNKVAIAYLAPREKDFSAADARDNDLMFIESFDDGLTWGPPVNVTSYLDTDPERAYPDITITEYNDNFHVVWTAIEYDYASDTYSDQKCKLKHWSDFDYETTTFVWADNEQSCTPGQRTLNIAKPTLTECDNGNLYVVYTRFAGDTDDGTEDCSAGGYANGEIYAQVAVDDGFWWGEPINLTNTTSNNCAAGDCYSENWPSTTHDCYDSLRIAYIGDTDAGAYEASVNPALREGSQTECDMMFLEKECFDFVPYADWRISNDDFSSPPMTCEASGSVDTSFTMINRGSLELNFAISVGSGSAAPYLSFYGPTSLIGHERDTAEFIIEFSAPPTPGTYSTDLIVDIYDTGEAFPIPVAFEVTGETEYECGDANDDDLANITDAVYLIQWIFNDGPAPIPLEAGDANCDGLTNITDAVYLIQYIFGGGAPPCDTDDDGEPDC